MLALILLLSAVYADDTIIVDEIFIMETEKSSGIDYYDTFKKDLSKYGFSYSIDLSYMPQRGTPDGYITPNQFIFSPSFTWEILSNTAFGGLEIQFAYSDIQYWGREVSELNNNLGVATGINDYSSSTKEFSELLLTYTFPDVLNWLSINVGQYSLYFIDGPSPISNQQTNLISYSLSQNGSATYPIASFGGFLQFNPTSEWTIQLGFQDATNIDGKRIDLDNWSDGKYTTFMYISWNHTFGKDATGQYMFLTYNQPSVELQPEESNGWSFSFSQYFNKVFNIFGRINGANGDAMPIEKSYVLGFGFTNPFNRNTNDYLGLAMSVNQINKTALGVEQANKYENVIEAQYVIGLSKYFTITPDIQYIINPATSKEDYAFVYSLRLGVML